jgi:enterochelin esterase family protein
VSAVVAGACGSSSVNSPAGTGGSQASNGTGGGAFGSGGAAVSSGGTGTGGTVTATGGTGTGGTVTATGGTGTGGTVTATGGTGAGGAGLAASSGGTGMGGAVMSTGGVANGGSAPTGSGGSSAGGASAGASGAAGKAGGDGSAGGSTVADPGIAGDGKFTINSPFKAAPESATMAGVAKGTRMTFMMSNAASKYYPGGSRQVTVYIPVGYVANTPAPVLVVQDGTQYGPELMTVMDNLIAANRIPKTLGIMINPGANRSGEYDTVSDTYFKFVTEEVIPLAETTAKVKVTTDPQGRAAMGGSSGAPAAMGMAWFGDFLRLMTYSGTFVNLQSSTMYPHGAWEYGENLIPNAPMKPGLRIALEVGSMDNGATETAESFRNWRLGNEALAAALMAKGYHYKFNYAIGAVHVDGGVRSQTEPDVMEWLWQGYPK